MLPIPQKQSCDDCAMSIVFVECRCIAYVASSCVACISFWSVCVDVLLVVQIDVSHFSHLYCLLPIKYIANFSKTTKVYRYRYG